MGLDAELTSRGDDATADGPGAMGSAPRAPAQLASSEATSPAAAAWAARSIRVTQSPEDKSKRTLNSLSRCDER